MIFANSTLRRSFNGPLQRSDQAVRNMPNRIQSTSISSACANVQLCVRVSDSSHRQQERARRAEVPAVRGALHGACLPCIAPKVLLAGLWSPVPRDHSAQSCHGLLGWQSELAGRGVDSIDVLFWQDLSPAASTCRDREIDQASARKTGSNASVGRFAEGESHLQVVAAGQQNHGDHASRRSPGSLEEQMGVRIAQRIQLTDPARKGQPSKAQPLMAGYVVS